MKKSLENILLFLQWIVLITILSGAIVTVLKPELISRFIQVYVLGKPPRSAEAEAYYQEYYAHFYATYSKETTKEIAHYYANYYADFYARYYASDDYKLYLQYALPESTPENLSYPQSVISSMALDSNGYRYIKHFEGYRNEPYLDAGGKMTIGYGHLVKHGEYYSKISDEQANTLLVQDVKLAEAIVKQNVTVPLTQNQFSALVSFVYNIGPNHFQKSTLLKKLNNQEYNEASDEFYRWVHVGDKKIKGLEKRRQVERALFLSS